MEVITIDPATIKLILYAIQKMIEDEEARKRVFYIIAVPVVFIILLISMIYYMFIMPLVKSGAMALQMLPKQPDNLEYEAIQKWLENMF